MYRYSTSLNHPEKLVRGLGGVSEKLNYILSLICVFLYMNTRIYVCVHRHEHMCILYVHRMYICIYTQSGTCSCVYMHVVYVQYMHMCIACVLMYVLWYIFMYGIYVHTFIWMCICVFVYTYTGAHVCVHAACMCI